LEEKKYTKDRCLIVSELSRCPFFERDRSAPKNSSTDCFFCRFSDFRKQEYIQRIENEVPKGVLFSACHNEKNQKSEI
jgi:hypothetical protein